MIDLDDMNIMFTLNGEMLIRDSGSELAFTDIEIGDGKFLPFKKNAWKCLFLQFSYPNNIKAEALMCPNIEVIHLGDGSVSMKAHIIQYPP